MGFSHNVVKPISGELDDSGLVSAFKMSGNLLKMNELTSVLVDDYLSELFEFIGITMKAGSKVEHNLLQSRKPFYPRALSRNVRNEADVIMEEIAYKYSLINNKDDLEEFRVKQSHLIRSLRYVTSRIHDHIADFGHQPSTRRIMELSKEKILEEAYKFVLEMVDVGSLNKVSFEFGTFIEDKKKDQEFSADIGAKYNLLIGSSCNRRVFDIKEAVATISGISTELPHNQELTREANDISRGLIDKDKDFGFPVTLGLSSKDIASVLRDLSMPVYRIINTKFSDAKKHHGKEFAELLTVMRNMQEIVNLLYIDITSEMSILTFQMFELSMDIEAKHSNDIPNNERLELIYKESILMKNKIWNKYDVGITTASACTRGKAIFSTIDEAYLSIKPYSKTGIKTNAREILEKCKNIIESNAYTHIEKLFEEEFDNTIPLFSAYIEQRRKETPLVYYEFMGLYADLLDDVSPL